MDRISKRKVILWSAVGLAVICLLDLSALAKGGFPSNVVGGTSVSAGGQPATEWWFAAGSTAGGVVTELHLLNPSARESLVSLRYFAGGGFTTERRLSVPGQSALTVAVAADRAAGMGGGYPGLSVEVNADVPLVVERTMAFNAPDEHRTGISVGPGLTQLTGAATFLAGSTAQGGREWVSLLNPSEIPVTVFVHWEGGGHRVDLLPNDRHDLELPLGLAAPNLSLTATAPIAVERVVQTADVDGVDVSGPAAAGATFAPPLLPGVKVVTTSGLVEWQAEETDPTFADSVVQPAAAAATEWGFAEWGGPGQSDLLLLHNPGPSPAAVFVGVDRRSVFGDGLGPPPLPSTRVWLNAGESRVVLVTMQVAAVDVTAASPVLAWRVERSHRSYVRNYDDPGFG